MAKRKAGSDQMVDGTADEADHGNGRKKRTKFSSTQDDGTASSSSRGPPTLLTIPGELRNRIYEYALVEPDRVILGSANAALPGLLRSCQQLRKEATSIFYERNSFIVTTTNYKLEPQMEHWFCKKRSVLNSVMLIQGQPVWANFKDWLQAYWQGRAYRISAGPVGDPAREEVIPKAFELLHSLRNVPWNVVEQALEVWRESIDAAGGQVRFV